MAIRNPVIFGLKVEFNFTDTLSKTECLNNLGLRLTDLNRIKGVSQSGLSKNDLQNLSGLDVNLTRYLDRLYSDTSLYSGIITGTAGYNAEVKGNFEAYGPVSGGAVRYLYIPNNLGPGLNQENLKYGDISTSRVSSWSSATSDETDTEQPISYGASVQLKRTLRIGQKPNFVPPTLESIVNVLDLPEPIRYPTEVATDIIEIQVNGQSKYVYAMRGIPIVFTTAFKNVAVDLTVIPIPSGNPIYVIQDVETNQEIRSIPFLTGNNTSQLRYYGPTFRERNLKIYFPPNNITGLGIGSLSIVELPPVKFLSLLSLDINRNLITTFPDFTNLNYEYSIQSPTTAPSSTIQSLNVSYNNFRLSEIPELTKFGTNIVERLPKTLRSIDLTYTFVGETAFENIESSLVIKASNAEFNSIVCDPDIRQQYTFNIPTRQDPNAISNIEGIFYDKLNYSSQLTQVNYVYVKDVKVLRNGSLFGGAQPSQDYEGQDFINLVQNTYTTAYRDYFELVDLSTRTPFLQSFYYPNGGLYHYQTALSKTPNDDLVTYNSIETTPKVSIRDIISYQIPSHRFRKLNPIFISPGQFLKPGEICPMQSFSVNSNYELTEVDNGINFSAMTQIRSIDMSATRLPIPIGLQNNTNLSYIGCSYVSFPARTSISIPNPYTELHPSGGYIDPLTGDGNPSNSNNILFTTKYPLGFNEYVFTGCSSLGGISFYASSAGGMIPKFVGNDSLSAIDLRGCNEIEGGRPPNLTENDGFHGRRFVMWDNTFQDCADSITDIRIVGTNLGRNIGIYNPVTKKYTEATFQGSTFSLAQLRYLEIGSTGFYLKGPFFSLSSCPNLDTLISVNSGWGLDLPDGAPLPSFASNTRIRYIYLYGNNFSGGLSLNNLTSLEAVYLQNNIIESISVYANLPSLKVLNLTNNTTLTGTLPVLNQSPNIQTLAFSNCSISTYTAGSLVNATSLRSLDLSNNKLNQSSVDNILEDCIINYNNAPRPGVVINLSGTNAPPSRVVTVIPTVNTTEQQLVVDVEQPPAQTPPVYQDNYTQVYRFDNIETQNPNDFVYSRNTQLTLQPYYPANTPPEEIPNPVVVQGTRVLPTSDGVGLPIYEDGGAPQTVASDGTIDLDANGNVIITTPPQNIPRVFQFYSKQSTAQQLSQGIPDGSVTSAGPSLDIKEGVDPNDSNISYQTQILVDGFDFTSNVQIDFANNKIIFPVDANGGGYPETGTQIVFKLITTVRGTIERISGGVITVQTLRSLGWIVNTA